MFTVYILRTNKNTLYTGYTNNLRGRLAKHKAKKGAKHLRMFKSFKLVYTEEFKTRSEAMRREFELKKLSKQEKEYLITTNELDK